METKEQFEARKKIEARKNNKPILESATVFQNEIQTMHDKYKKLDENITKITEGIKGNKIAEPILDILKHMIESVQKDLDAVKTEFDKKIDFKTDLAEAGFSNISDDLVNNQIQNIGKAGNIKNKKFNEYVKLGILTKGQDDSYSFNKNTWDTYQSGEKMKTIRNNHAGTAQNVAIFGAVVMYIGAAIASENGINSIQDRQAIILMVGAAIVACSIAWYLAGETNSSGRRPDDIESLRQRREVVTRTIADFEQILGTQGLTERFTSFADRNERLLTSLNNTSFSPDERSNILLFNRIESSMVSLGDAGFRRIISDQTSRDSFIDSIINSTGGANINREMASQILQDIANGKQPNFGQVNINGNIVDINTGLISNIIASEGRITNIKTNDISIDGKKTIGDLESNLKKNDILKADEKIETFLKIRETQDIKTRIEKKIDTNSEQIQQNKAAIGKNNSTIVMNDLNIRDGNNAIKKLE